MKQNTKEPFFVPFGSSFFKQKKTKATKKFVQLELIKTLLHGGEKVCKIILSHITAQNLKILNTYAH